MIESKMKYDGMNDRDKILENVNKLFHAYKQPLIWKKICETVENKLDGDIRNLFIRNGFCVKKIKEYI